MSTHSEELTPIKRALLALDEMKKRLAAAERQRSEPIAIVGMGCRYPGDANDPDAFWRILTEGKDVIAEVPPERWDLDAVYDPRPGAPGKTYMRHGGFLKNVDQFDPCFFGVAPVEARSIDPQGRLVLEVAWEALEHAGLAPDRVRGTATGVFVGVSFNDYALAVRSATPSLMNAFVGASNTFVAGRLSYLLGLQGPSLALDTACSSALTAVHLACLSLRSRECSLALAGGVNLMLHPEETILLSAANHMLSPDGRCRAFDASANGIVRSEGCGLVVLKRLSDAEADGDPIIAVIRGSAANHVGASSGLTVPSGRAQEELIRRALADAGVGPGRVGYVEAHGTGTPLGDPIEAEALGLVMRGVRAKDAPLLVGSLKTNFGHMESAAGVAGLMKAALALEAKEIPPHLHLKRLNPSISWEELPLSIPTQRTRWEAKDGPRIAGVSSFGASGTNVHLILEEYPAREVPQAKLERPLHLLPLSAKTKDGLVALAGRYRRYLDEHADASIADLCFTAGVGRAHLEHRLAVLARSPEQLAQALRDFEQGEPNGESATGALGGATPKIAFLFTGQGSQYVGMGRALYQAHPVFREVLDRCDAALRTSLEQPLLSVLFAQSEGGSPLAQTAYTQPALFALEMALVALWRSWGVEPGAVLGHSVGEYAAACTAGVFSLEDGLRLIAERGRLMQALPLDGEMAAIFAEPEEVAQAVAPYRSTVSIAAINGPTEVVISGLREDVRRVGEAFTAKGVKTRSLSVSHAFHSPLMDPIAPEFARAAAAVRWSAPRLTFVSNLTGQPATREVTDADYWCRHVREPVRFHDGLQRLREKGYTLFLEVGPQPTLCGMGAKCLPPSAAAWLPSLKKDRDDWKQMLLSLGRLYTLGGPVDWIGCDRPYPRRRLRLPTYPFQRERCWVDAQPEAATEAHSEARGVSAAPAGSTDDTSRPPATSPTPPNGARLDWLLGAPPDRRRDLLIARVQKLVASVLGFSSSRELDPRRGFTALGMNSLMAVELRTRLGEAFGVEIPATVAFDHPTVESLTTFLESTLLTRATEDTAKAQVANGGDEPIAVIGMACRLPGGADSPEGYWRILSSAQDVITDIPADRWDVDAHYSPEPGADGKMISRRGGFLSSVDGFDASFFGISPREAVTMDPQQRLLLEVTWEALEDADAPADRLTGSRTGVFIGANNFDYMRVLERSSLRQDTYVSTGNASCVVAGRLSYLLGLQGPSMVIDTACSSALVATHLACRALRDGECDLAVAGGVNLILSPEISIGMSKLGALSPDGRCKSFDASADGYGRGEGCGVVVLKRLSEARAAGDRILGVIKGSAVNQDGPSGGLTVPSGPAQQAVIREALARAGVAPADVDYVETHGTGTRLGDPIEAQALGAALAPGRPPDRPVRIGTAKAHIGHLESAAGVAGLIKVLLMLRHGEIPPLSGLTQPNPLIPWDRLPLRLPATTIPWQAGARPRIAGVSSFGMSGTNAHLIVEEPPNASPRPLASSQTAPSGPYLLPLSARSPEALRQLARAHADLLASNPGQPLFDLCYTAAVRRSHHPHRLSVSGSTAPQLAERLRAFADGEQAPGTSVGHHPQARRRVVFVFPGQGSQWHGMGRALLDQSDVFRQTIEACDQAIRAHADWSLLELLAADAADPRLSRIDVVQPMLFALEVALAAVWRSWGVEPDAVVGHSMGEAAAACVAGALSLSDGARVICRRSHLLRGVSGRGAMAVVELPVEQAREALAGYGDRLAVAVCNAPDSAVLSGDPAALDEVLATLEARQVFCRRVKVDVASHSPHMDPLRDDLLAALQPLAPRSANVAFYSTVTAELMDGAGLDGPYWARNLREPVLFWNTVERLLREEHSVFIEMSPHPLLLRAVESGAFRLERECIALPSMRRDEDELSVLRESLGGLYAAGHPLDWRRLWPAPGAHASLPPYPWQRKRYWADVRPDDVAPDSGRRGTPNRALLRRGLRSARVGGPRFWEVDVDRRSFPFLGDHQVHRASLIPSTIAVEMAFEAAREAFGPGPCALTAFSVVEDLVLLDQQPTTLQIIVTPEPATSHASFEVFAVHAGESPGATLHATGQLVVQPVGEGDDVASSSFDEARGRCAQETPGPTHYASLRDSGLELGPSFQGIERLRRGAGEALAELHLPEALVAEAPRYVVHPALLDTCLRLLASTLPDGTTNPADLVPAGFRRAAVYGPLDGPLRAHATLRACDAPTFVGDVQVRDGHGKLVLEVLGLRLGLLQRKVLQRAAQDRVGEGLYSVEWATSEPRPRPTPDAEPGAWLVLSDAGGLGAALAAQLRGRGDRCVLVHAGTEYERLTPLEYRMDPRQAEHFRRLLGDVQAPGLRMVHLWSLDADGEPSRLTLEAAQTHGAQSLLHLSHALAGAGGSSRLWVITRGAEPADEAPESRLSLAQAAVWGLGRAISVELPSAWGGLIDLDPSAPDGGLESLLAELTHPDGEDQVALRGRDRKVPRLARRAMDLAGAPRAEPRADATYLLTDALCGPGAHVARWLVEKGARHLVLTRAPGRPGASALETAERETVAALEQLGATVLILPAAPQDARALRHWLETAGATAPPLRGIVHTTSQWGLRLLGDLDATLLRSTWEAEAATAWCLHELGAELELDFFVTFSSVASVWGAGGLAHHAAAHHFLDALAHHRRRLGLPALSINWVQWANLGMLPDDAYRLSARSGVSAILPEQALEALDLLLSSTAPQSVVAPVDWSVFKPASEVTRPRPLLERMETQSGPAEEPDSTAKTDVVRRLEQALPGERTDLLLEHLQGVVGSLLGFDPSETLEPTQGFFQMGMDSIMSVELRKRLERQLGRALPPNVVFNYPSLDALARFLLDEVLALSAAEPSNDDRAAAMEELEELSEDQLLTILTEELTDMKGTGMRREAAIR